MSGKCCSTCKFCTGDVLGPGGKCSAVLDPITGSPMPVRVARLDTWNGYNMPCGFAGNRWVEKDAE